MFFYRIAHNTLSANTSIRQRKSFFTCVHRYIYICILYIFCFYTRVYIRDIFPICIIVENWHNETSTSLCIYVRQKFLKARIDGVTSCLCVQHVDRYVCTTLREIPKDMYA